MNKSLITSGPDCTDVQAGMRPRCSNATPDFLVMKSILFTFLGLQMRCVIQYRFSYFATKTNVLATQKNRLNLFSHLKGCFI